MGAFVGRGPDNEIGVIGGGRGRRANSQSGRAPACFGSANSGWVQDPLPFNYLLNFMPWGARTLFLSKEEPTPRSCLPGRRDPDASGFPARYGC